MSGADYAATVTGVELGSLSEAGQAAWWRLAELASESDDLPAGLGELFDRIRDVERQAAATQLRDVVTELIDAADSYHATPTLQHDHRLAAARRQALDAVGVNR